jgi:hypothetical protein
MEIKHEHVEMALLPGRLKSVRHMQRMRLRKSMYAEEETSCAWCQENMGESAEYFSPLVERRDGAAA